MKTKPTAGSAKNILVTTYSKNKSGAVIEKKGFATKVQAEAVKEASVFRALDEAWNGGQITKRWAILDRWVEEFVAFVHDDARAFKTFPLGDGRNIKLLVARPGPDLGGFIASAISSGDHKGIAMLARAVKRVHRRAVRSENGGFIKFRPARRSHEAVEQAMLSGTMPTSGKTLSKASNSAVGVRHAQRIVRKIGTTPASPGRLKQAKLEISQVKSGGRSTKDLKGIIKSGHAAFFALRRNLKAARSRNK